jgi:hypothetical protein
MLKIMKNEEKIFRAWLKRYLKDGGGLNRKQLAEKMDISASKLCYILTGRNRENGERYFQSFSFDLRQAALKATGVSYETAVRIGQEELLPVKENMPSGFWEVVRKEIQASLPPPPGENSRSPGPDPPVVLSEHQKKVEKFKDKGWGEYVNTILLEIEELDPEAKEEITDILEAKLKSARRRIRPTPGPQEKSSGS